MKLSKQRFERAVDFMKSSARPLEKALYHYHFEGAAAASVVDELAHFQNSDGGLVMRLNRTFA